MKDSKWKIWKKNERWNINDKECLESKDVGNRNVNMWGKWSEHCGRSDEWGRT